MSPILLLIFLYSLPCFANDTAEAERVRLSEEMGTLAARGQWVAVERKYQQIIALKKVSLRYGDHMIGAQAASGMGNIALSYARVQLALQIEDQPEGQQWKADIEANYARVSLKTEKKSGMVTLAPDKMPFIPEQQLAIKLATKELSTTGAFEGLLPYGDYTAGATKFSLTRESSNINDVFALSVSGSGGAVAAVDDQPPKEPRVRTETPIGPWVSLGGSYLQAGATELEAAAFDSQGGINGQAGLGFQLKLNSKLRLGLNASYESTRVADQAEDMLDPQLKRYQAWLPLGLAPSESMTYWFGPSYFIASTTITGTTQNSALEQGVAFEGLSGGLGLQVGLQKNLFSMGSKLGGGILITSGVEHDGQRLYSWGELAFSMTPQFREKDKS